MGDTARVALWHQTGEPIEIVEKPLPVPGPGETLVKVRLATICGSDLHTITGRRSAPTPCVLGHEVVGEVAVATNETSATGRPLRPGDRITWSIMASCGKCTYCSTYDLPQKCESLFKYGHARSEGQATFSGGYADYVLLRPGTAIYHIPDSISDEEAASINCALATVIDGLRGISVNTRGCAVVMGAGLLGIYTTCWLREQGFRDVVVVEPIPERLAFAERFGATHGINPISQTPEEIQATVHQRTDGTGADVAVEVSGVVSGLQNALGCLRLGGECLTLGLVSPGANVSLDASHITLRCLTVRGHHNYHPSALTESLAFLAHHRDRYLFRNLVGITYPLDQINEALAMAQTGKHIRVAVCPLLPLQTPPYHCQFARTSH